MGAVRALVVDDNFYNRDIAKLALEFSGCEVTLAVDGEQALEKLNSTYDLIILDLQMARLDGLGALKVIRGYADERSKVTVIVMTALQKDQVDPMVYALADYVMFKPLDVVAFRDFVVELQSTLVHHAA